MLLVIGGCIGGIAVYFYTSPAHPVSSQQIQATPELEPKAPPKFATFESSRREVDVNPEKYLEANKAYEPDADAADFYLKGRALLRIGDYYNAKLSLLEAKKRIKPDTDDAATLETEIALALAVAGDPPASESLKKDLTDWANAANTASNSNATNSGSANRSANLNR
ncbi:MAG: hypothetical protein ACRD43_00430, partial [Pyrinomonadaceae bacterium]